MSEYYEALDRIRFDYALQLVPGIPGRRFRGPPVDRSRPFIACLGGAQTFGRFCDQPYPILLTRALGIQTLNLGAGGAGPRYFNKPEYLAWLNLASLVVVQVMSGRSESNSLFDTSSGTLRGVRRADGRTMRFEQFLAELRASSTKDEVERVLSETRENYLKSTKELLESIKVPKILLWLSRRSPEAGGEAIWDYPQLVNREMLDRISSHVDAAVEATCSRGLPQPLWRAHEKIEGAALRDGLLLNNYYPSPEMHEYAAELLAPVCRTLLEAGGSKSASRAPAVQPARRQEPGRPDVLMGLHIPKCAGTTLLRRAESRLPSRALHQTTSIRRAFQEGQLSFLALQSYDQLRLVFGHSVHEEMIKWLPRPPILFTGLRDPVARYRSAIAYRSRLLRQGYRGAQPPAPPQPERDPICWFIIWRFPTLAGTEGTAAERAWRALQAFSLCYFPDTLEATADVLFDRLGIAPERNSYNISKEPPPDAAVDPDLLRHDLELYRLARERFAQCGPVAATPSEAVRHLHAMPRRPEVLRKFLHGEYLREFEGWHMLDEVVHQRQAQIAELRMELSHFQHAKSRR